MTAKKKVDPNKPHQFEKWEGQPRDTWCKHCNAGAGALIHRKES